jgi:ABC-2 type transport system permease protein
VPANTHFLSKIISSMLFIAIQSTLLLIFGFIGQLISTLFSKTNPSLEGVASVTELIAQYFPQWQSIVFFSILFIIVGSIFYLVIAAVIAASSVTQEDYQQFQSPMMLTLVAGFYIAIFASAAEAYGVLKVVSFIPFFAPLVVPVAYAVGAISIVDMVIALVLTSLFTFFIIKLIAPIYKVAILSYDQTKFMTRIKHYVKKSKYIK